MAGKSGFSVSIALVDQASAKLDAINKRIGAMNAPAEKFNKSLVRFGDVTGLSKLSDGMLSLGNSTLGAARALEGMMGPMAAISSASSIAGLVMLERTYAATGNTIRKTANALNMPVEKMSRMETAYHLAGSSAEAADASMKGLGKTLYDAFYGDAGARTALTAQGVHWSQMKDGKEVVADTTVAMGELADTVSKYGNNVTKVNGLESVGVDRDSLTVLDKGKAGLEGWLAEADKTGAVWSTTMADHASAVQKAFAKLEEDLKGIGNHIADDWSDVATRAMAATSRWIEANKPLAKYLAETAGVLATVAGSAGTALTLRAILRKLAGGSGKVAGEGGAEAAGAAAEAAAAAPGAALPAAAESATVVAAETAAKGVLRIAGKLAGPIAVVADVLDPTAIDPNDTEGALLRKHRNDASGPGTSDTGAPGTSDTGTGGQAPASVTNDLLTGLANQRLGKLLAKGEAGASDYNAVNRGAAGNYAAGMENLVNKTVAQVQADQEAHRYNAAGRYQIIGPTLKSAIAGLGLTGGEKFDSAMQDRIFEQYLIAQKRPEIADYIFGRSKDRHAAQLGGSKEWASVADPDTGLSHYGGVGNNKASISAEQFGAALDQARDRQAAASGHVHVVVTLKGATAGTAATAVATGAATAAPPRIETAMGPR